MPYYEAFPGPGDHEPGRTTVGGDNGEGLKQGRTTAGDVDTSHLKDEWEDHRRPTISFEGDAQEKVTKNSPEGTQDDDQAH